MIKKIALITGIAGQDGAYLADFLLRKKYKIIGVTPSVARRRLWRLDYFGILDKIKIIKGDITDVDLIKNIIIKNKPAEFYNLAGQSSVAKSWANPAATFKVNGLAVVQVLESIRLHSPRTRFFQASSAEMYGNTKAVITEQSNNFDPINPYGVSKLAAHLAVKNFRAQYGLFACNAILFNHESPLRSDFYVAKKIALGTARIALGTASQIELGNIDIRRDWSFVGDIVQAMWLMLNQSRADDFVICTGDNLAIKDFIREAFLQVGIRDWRKHIKINHDLVRKSEIKNMRGSNRCARKSLGWRPRTDFKELVRLMVNYELDKLRKK